MKSLVLCLLLALPPVAVTAAASGPDALLEDLSSPAERVRERALTGLRDAVELPDDVVRRALGTAGVRARALLFEVIAARGMRGLAPEVVLGLSHPDPVVWEAAARAVVALGDETVAAALDALAPDDDPSAANEKRAPRDARVARVRALHAQAEIERDLLARWMRKGGNYDGRFAELAEHGWPVQPVLLAMLLDVPLEDRFIVLPETESEVMGVVQKMEALDALAESPRRGYRTFVELPIEVDEEEIFDLASQALADVADIDVMGDILDQLAQTLDRADSAAGWQLRPAERAYAETLEEILANHGRPERLLRRIERLALEARNQKRWADRAGPANRSDALQHYATDLGRLARAVYRMRDWDRAAAIYAEAMEIMTDIAGRPTPVTAYNRACALAKGGRKDEALDQLDAALAIQDSGSDLTRDWVEEDGDLRSLRDDPRWPVILDRHFGKRPAPPSPPR